MLSNTAAEVVAVGDNSDCNSFEVVVPCCIASRKELIGDGLFLKLEVVISFGGEVVGVLVIKSGFT